MRFYRKKEIHKSGVSSGDPLVFDVRHDNRELIQVVLDNFHRTGKCGLCLIAPGELDQRRNFRATKSWSAGEGHRRYHVSKTNALCLSQILEDLSSVEFCRRFERD